MQTPRSTQGDYGATMHRAGGCRGGGIVLNTSKSPTPAYAGRRGGRQEPRPKAADGRGHAPSWCVAPGSVFLRLWRVPRRTCRLVFALKPVAIEGLLRDLAVG